MGELGFVADIHQQKRAGSIGVFHHALPMTRLPERRRLLIARHARNRNRAAEKGREGFAIDMAARQNVGQEGAGNVEEGQQFVVPLAGDDVEEERAGGIGNVGGMDRAAGQTPQQERIYRSESDFAPFGARSQSGHIVQQPADFRAGEIGVERQAGSGAKEGFVSLTAQLVAQRGGAPVLPHDGIGDRSPGFALPEDRRFALVGDADGGDVGGC